MARRTKPNEDDWQNVTDARKRKQIQDRLAQRARRRRLRDARGENATLRRDTSQISDSNGSPSDQDRTATNLTESDEQASSSLERTSSITSKTWHITELPDDNATSPAFIDLQISNDFEHMPLTPQPSWRITEHDGQNDLSTFEPPATMTSLTDPSLLPANIHAIPSPLTTTLTLPLTVFTALFLNGQILSIPCSIMIASKSPPATARIPISLRPTASQLSTVHFQWIDRLPFPKLRDSLIRLQGVLDLDEFLEDIFLQPSFRIRKGGRSWEARAWSMEEGWAGKWGWLFY